MASSGAPQTKPLSEEMQSKAYINLGHYFDGIICRVDLISGLCIVEADAPGHMV